MTLDEYKTWTRTVWQNPDLEDIEEDSVHLMHACMGLAGEAGEVVDIFKKIVFTPHRLEGQDYRAEVVKELGDVLYYLARIADECNITLDEVLETNVNKLEKRYGRSSTSA